MDGLKMICEELHKCAEHGKCNDYNEIVCAKSVLRRYIGNDRNRLLKIKAELQKEIDREEQSMNVLPVYVSMVAFLVSAAGYVLNKSQVSFYILMMFAAIFVVERLIDSFNKKDARQKKRKWIWYIQFALEDLEKEMK